ncbi:glycoside hydrolase family 6 protein [Streptomyces hypolithicus]
MRNTTTALTLTALAAALLLGAPAADADDTPVGGGSGGARLYAPAANPAAYDQADVLDRAGRPEDAGDIRAMARTPHAVWLAGQTPAEVRAETRGVVRDAARRRELPTLVLYNVPGRDCSLYSAGGLGDSEAYRDWIDAVAHGIGGSRALVVLEPDALALIPADCPGGGGGGGEEKAKAVATAARYAQVSDAVDTLATLPRTKVYVDAGYPAWHSVTSIVPRLIKGGVGQATGFAVNVSNYSVDSANAWYGRLISFCLAHVADAGKPADCPDQYTPRADAQRWLDRHKRLAPDGMAHFVTDTSRNGRGPWTPPAGKYADAQDWCNPPDRGLGVRPTTRTADPLHDAKLWIKTPGESDGQCLRGTKGPRDPERGTLDPKAGEWFPQQALELVRFSNPALGAPAHGRDDRG